MKEYLFLTLVIHAIDFQLFHLFALHQSPTLPAAVLTREL
jgi:hypothetical protein